MTKSALSTYDLSWDAWLNRAYRINWEVVIYLLILVVAVGSRFYQLGDRVMSHDESLHTYYSWRLYDAGDFQHTPLMHGPLLFHITAFFYFLFGDSDFSARIYTVLLGIGIVMFPYLFRRWLGRSGAIIAALILLLSPMLTYYSRYIRHDIPTIFYALVMIYAMMQYMDGEKPRKSLWMSVFSGALLLMLASKEVAFIYIAIFGTFLTVYWAVRLLQDFPLQHRPTPQALSWKPPRWQQALGHLAIVGVALVLGFMGGELLYLWQYAEFAWLWVGVGVALVLLVRVIPLVWDALPWAFESGHSTAILNLALLFALVVGLLVVVGGAVNYHSANNQLRLEDANLVNQADAIPTPETRDALENTRRQAAILALVGGVLALAGLVWVVLSSPGSGWLLNTVAAVGVVALVLVLLKLITASAYGSPRVLQFGMMAILFLCLESVGVIRTFIARSARPGIAQLLTEGMARGKSALLIIFAGTILGAVLAVHIFGVLDVVKPSQVFVQRPIETAAPVDGDAAPPPTLQTSIDTRLGNAWLLWIGLPIAAVLVLLLLVAVVQTPTNQALPWADMLALLLVALIVGSVLVFIERRSLINEETHTDTPVAIDPTEESAAPATSDYNRTLILATVVGVLSLAGLIAAWRLFLPHHWDWLNRQPAFDVLIMMGTLILPWASAYPIFLAGYTLDAAPLPIDTVRVSILVTGSVLILCAVIGAAWNWRVWVLANVIFLSLFVFFFTTVFTNGAGIFTGMVGSLGYWLEQHDVRRGSQPQYYYTLIQLPMYEYMALLLAGAAGVAGLGGLFRWRGAHHTTNPSPHFSPDETIPLNMREVMAAQTPLPRHQEETEAEEENPEGFEDRLAMLSQEVDRTKPLDMERLIREQPALAEVMAHFEHENTAPYDHAEEIIMREASPEWLGGLPFMAFVGYWAVLMIVGLSIAGEKMPWLTVHMTIPLAFAGGWYAGGVIEKISWESLRKGGWALLLFLVPVGLVALLSVLSPLVGGSQPFNGLDQTSLGTTNTWLAALLVLLGSAYFSFRIIAQIGLGQAGRVTLAGLVVILGLLSARTTIMATYRNHDYATEFLVYAHSGPAVKITMDMIDYFADRTNEGREMRVAYDDDSSWPMTWYMRHYKSSFFAGEASALESNPSPVEGARVVVVGGRKNAAVERILGDEYYRFDYIRLWWPMQEYFNLNFDRVANVFRSEETNIAADLYRQGMWDIWWNRDYSTYAQAQCVEGKQFECRADANPNACYQRVMNECAGDGRYETHRWPVSDRMYVYVDKEIAAEIWDAGIGGQDVVNRKPQNAVDRVYREVAPLTTFGADVQLSGSRGVAVGPDGSVYVADTNNSRIVVFDPQGNFINQFGYPAAENADDPGVLFQPWGLEVAADGKVYIADTWNHRVQVFSEDGEPLTRWGGYGVPDDGANPLALWGPRDLAIGIDGSILVADTGGKRVRVYSPDGTWLRDLGFGGAGLGQLDEPVGLAVNPVSGEIYVADTWNRRVQVFSKDGEAVRTWEVPMWYDSRTSPDRPYLAVSPDGALVAVSDMNAVGRNDGPRIVVYDLAGNPLAAFNAPEEDFAAGLHGIRIVAGMAYAPDGSLYALDAETGRVVKFPPLPLSGSLAPQAPGTDAETAPEEEASPAENDETLGESISPPEELPFSDEAETSTEE